MTMMITNRMDPHTAATIIVVQSEIKSKITKILNLEENQFGKSIITWQNQITKRIKNEWTRTVIFLTWYRHFQM